MHSGGYISSSRMSPWFWTPCPAPQIIPPPSSPANTLSRTKHVPLGLSQGVLRVVRGNWSARAALSLRIKNSNCVAVGCCPTPNFQTETDTSSSQHGTEATSLICPPLNLPYKCTTQHTLFCKVIEHKSKMKSFYCCCHFWFSGTFVGPPNV